MEFNTEKRNTVTGREDGASMRVLRVYVQTRGATTARTPSTRSPSRIFQATRELVPNTSKECLLCTAMLLLRSSLLAPL